MIGRRDSLTTKAVNEERREKLIDKWRKINDHDNGREKITRKEGRNLNFAE